ncbi:MAG TPA: cyclic nucleotide-binding domain-containing protein [Candidatus Bathyarchaeia archaeon]|nr:cyclic nucleotide-binding domain-containing protein [Candidatus Bathyarchaeia archaeon]
MASKSTFEQEHEAPNELRLALQAIGNSVGKSKESILFRRGDKPVGVFLVREGRVRLSLDGTSVASRTLGPGSVLGLPATLNRRPYSLTATATENCQLDFIPREAVVRLLRKNTVVCFQALQVLGNEISDMRRAVDEVLIDHKTGL